MKLYLVGDRFIAQLDEEDMKEIEKKTSGINRPFPFRTVRKSFGGGKPSSSERRGTKPNKSTISIWCNEWYKFVWFIKFKRWIMRKKKDD